ncbi:candidapepsin-4 precursor [Rhizodiscina lignyota]|uniref:Probable aspartic-type endopeptidase OPSB n=1 Tax=Rhizodiscina lignyota TaxID=1504668 RepID=A0A9P4IE28_9PEZI|nr:candidapepsin-4 precursor [Rhizodiscina lignyota]
MQGPPAVLGLQTERKQITNPHIRDQLRRRQNTLTAQLDNEETLYFVNISLGGQQLRLDIDTGSSDLWANAPNSQICSEQGNFCAISGTYDANSSDSYNYVNSDFSIKYADGTFAEGDYATDTLKIGSTSIDNMQFGIGYNSTSQNGILGIGYESNEVQLAATGQTYRNLPTSLVNSNIIQSPAYSLWLNDFEANTGSILFGGVDTDKYHGQLSTLPLIKEQGEFREFIIALTGVSAANQSVFNDTSNAVPVLLDSGSSLTYLPDDIANSLFQVFNADYQQNEGAAIVDCNLANQDESVDFTFSSPTISVPLNELVVVAAIRGNGDPICILGIAPAGDSTPVLGDTFLRSAYVVYDLANNEISLAATNFNATSSNVQEIGTGDNAVPDATIIQNAVTTAAVSSGGARNGGLPSGITSGADRTVLAGEGLRIWGCMAVATIGMAMGVGLITL